MNIRGEALNAGASVPQSALDTWGSPAVPTGVPIPPELLEKIGGVAVLGPNDQLVITVDRRMSQADFDRVRAAFDESCGGSLKGRVAIVGGAECVAVLRDGSECPPQTAL